MDLIFLPLTILVINILAALFLAVVKDVINNVLRGETQLVLQKLSTNRHPARPDTPHVEISGRRAGLIGYLLTLFDLSPKVIFTVNSKEIRKSTISLHGHSMEAIPLSDRVSIQAESQRSLFWLVAAFLSLTLGMYIGVSTGTTFTQQLFNAFAWLVVTGQYIFAFYQSHVFQIMAYGSLRAGVSFKPSVLEGRLIRFGEVMEAAEVLMERIQETRAAGGSPQYAGHVPQPAAYLPPVKGAEIPPSTPYQPPAPAFAPAMRPSPAMAEDTHDQPSDSAGYRSWPTPPQVDRSNTGTLEYGDDAMPIESGTGPWNGHREPGTSDSIQMRQSVTRSETGKFLGMPMNFDDLDDYDDEELDAADDDTDGGGTHRGTVSWEEHADKTQDEMRAESELGELKKSRPKRGEAKLRLRELMRRFPQTEAANKARRMLERLESGQ